MSDPFVSQVEAFPFNYAPKGWMICAGQLLPIAQYQALFALLGTAYGGDGVRTFALPDLRGRIAVGSGGSTIQGAPLGEENHTLLTSEVPSHTHSLNADNNGTANGTNIPGSSVLPGSPYNATSQTGVGGYGAPGSATIGLAPTAPSGGSAGHSNMMPYLTINYCIAFVGVFPSRG